MEFVNTSEILRDHGFNEPVFNALEPNENNYKALLFQPQGVIDASDDGVKNRDAAFAEKQFTGVLGLGINSQADMVITPEYSLPWRVLTGSLNKGQQPETGKLWVLGCESIKLSELEELRKSLLPTVDMIYETIENPDPNRFVSPLAYVFRTTKREDKSPATIVLVQFKTCPLSDADHFEINGMQRGSKIYKLGGTNNQINLVSLICADSLKFEDRHANTIHRRSLIIHIQLNKDPRNPQFRGYRDRLLRLTGDDMEIVCLNWASNILMNEGGNEFKWKNIGGSAWYLRPKEFDVRDDVLDRNHKLGLYYTWLDQSRCHSLFLNYTPSVYELEATKTYHHSVPANLSRRRGPQMRKVYCWDANSDQWEEKTCLGDGLDDILSVAKNVSSKIKEVSEKSPLAVERLLALCVGKICNKSDWYHPKNVDSCKIDNSEIINRITFAQDGNVKAREFRNTRLIRSNYLWEILNDASNLPPALSDFKNGFKFSWSTTSPHQNVESNDTKKGATAVYMGEDSVELDRDEVKKILAKRLHETAENENLSIEQKQRLVVWYRDSDSNIKIHSPDEYIRYDQPRTDSEVDIGREDSNGH